MKPSVTLAFFKLQPFISWSRQKLLVRDPSSAPSIPQDELEGHKPGGMAEQVNGPIEP
jgi:hypothetical protein